MFFDVFCVNVGGGVLAVDERKNPKNGRINNSVRVVKHARYNDTPYPIWMKFCTVVGIPDLVTYAYFGVDCQRA